MHRTGALQLFPRHCCFWTQDVAGAEASPAFIFLLSSNFVQITDPALLIMCQFLLFFPSVLSSFMAAFNLGSFPTSQLEFLGVQPHIPHSTLTLLDNSRAVPNLSLSAGSPLNLATLEEQGWILLILAVSCVYTNQYNSALCLGNFSSETLFP